MSLTSWIFAGLSTALALVAVVIAARAFASQRFPHRKLADIELELSDLCHAVDSLRTSHRRLNARVGMREARAKQSAAAPESEAPAPDAALPAAHPDLVRRPGETAEAWKKRARLIIHGVK